MLKKLLLLRLLVIGLLASTIFSCEPSEEGCLDLFSKNFGFQAVNECDSCCVYPDMKLSINFIRDTFSYSFNDTIDLGGGDSLKFLNFDLLFSQFELQGEKGNYRIRDSVEIDDYFIKDDFGYIQKTTSKIIGATRFEDTLSSISFFLGFNKDSVETYKPFDQIDSNSELDFALDSLYVEESNQYNLGNFRIQLADSIRYLKISGDSHQLQFDVDRYVEKGLDWTINLQVDMHEVVNGLSASMTNEELIEVFSQNLLEAIIML
ncbi:MAG: hypothetical protein HKO66_09195 [Saprospiraceae bacterium]|nr:hypothetical protein [Bacteroidia bacterium]NNL92393.1 hypothetical protein [Saprospiraceae bacterium]